MRYNAKNFKICAFCRHWYDPCNSAITPLMGKNMYEVDTNAKSKCILTNFQKRASGPVCKDYDPKV